ncbi:hypothetical protein [Gallaecimonas pentaromativorans]|uniref:Uncharacterized protein n=1 Tax=Gallaecimonas pentaromativorans TaxID=584787 RepID=A0A3N1P5J2_9GAMM|nr:hypothetical protein [Gallaecimonas pentaromativorans]ROQ23369.1 hypothetical protein EDC28_108107 [Gallaecimonas pentaromativorans]
MKWIAVVSLLLASAGGFADELMVTTKIQTLYMGPLYGSLVFVGVENKPTQARPNGCTEDSNFDFVLDLNSNFGKEYYSALLAAYSAGRQVRLQSYDNCNLYGSVPTLKTLWLK